MQATVLVPTYNESANLESMLHALARVLREGDRVLVIDDNSPDGTGELADRLAEELPFVDVLHREHAVVPGIGGIFSHAPVLKAGVDDVATAGPDHAFRKLQCPVAKVLFNILRTQI